MRSGSGASVEKMKMGSVRASTALGPARRGVAQRELQRRGVEEALLLGGRCVGVAIGPERGVGGGGGGGGGGVAEGGGVGHGEARLVGHAQRVRGEAEVLLRLAQPKQGEGWGQGWD
eukprot:scaffold26928_cov59-Phaeocystis_antarctica.AAC.5